MKLMLITAIVFGVSAFGLDAFFAHGLRNFLAQAYTDEAAHALTTASRYQLMASIFLLVLILWFRSIPSYWVIASLALTILGVLFFCVTIYVRHLCQLALVAKLAPFGGIAFMLAFLALLPLVLSL